MAALVSETLDEYGKDRGDMVSAALAYYTLMSIAPFIIIAVAIAGAILGRGRAEHEVLRVLSDTMGPKVASTVHEWVEQASASGAAASAIGFVLVLYTASRLTGQLRVALNQVWNVDPFQAEGFKASIRDYVRRRLFAFVLVVASGPLLLAVFASRAALTGLYDVLFAESPFAGAIVQLAQVLFSFLLVALISAVVFKLIPDTHVGWRSVIWGGLLTSLLFNLGNWLVGLYLARATVAQAYGAAGSAIVVLLWLYFSSQLFVLGAEFTQVYAAHYGRNLNPVQTRELREAERSAKREQGRAAEGGASTGM
jgi:membrane protein